MSCLYCPICHAALLRQQMVWRCAQNHCFDVAKEGYVNLLPAQHKHSKSPGDTPASLKARRDFLATGHYAPLRNTIMDLLKPLQANQLLDIGCGEGYYTRGMADVIGEANVYGIDIAKPAIQMAAKSYANIQFVVATSALLPIATQSMSVVCSLFAPIPIEEICRVLHTDGYLIVVTPAPEHLLSMRQQLFEQINPHQPQKFLVALAPYFNIVTEQQLTYPIQLEQHALQALIAMTPYAYKAKQALRTALEALPKLETTAAFQIYVLQRNAQDLPTNPEPSMS